MRYGDNDTALYYDELTTTDSYTSELFKQGWQNRIEVLERRLERYKTFDNVITQCLQDRGFLTYDEYDAFCSWLYHSSIEPEDIPIKIFGRQS